MAGFKSGAADDDWDDDDTDAETDVGDHKESTPEPNQDPYSTPAPEPDQERNANTSRLPWIHRRSSITDGREKTVQLHLQHSTVGSERDGKAEVEQLLGESVRKADLREAALLVGLEHSDEIAAVLREWGYAIE